MPTGGEFIATNVEIYLQIAEEAFESMEKAFEGGRRKRADGEGWIITLDPTHRSFKSAIIYITFSGMWLEAKLHLTVSQRYGKTAAKKVDRRDYESKLELLGLLDADLRSKLKDFRDLRRELMHEKALFDRQNSRYAQHEARKVRTLMQELQMRFNAVGKG